MMVRHIFLLQMLQRSYQAINSRNGRQECISEHDRLLFNECDRAFKSELDVERHKAMDRLLEFMTDNPRLTRCPEVFWELASIVSKNEIKEANLPLFVETLVETGLLRNANANAVVDYYVKHNAALTDLWILRWMICALLPGKNQSYRICNNKLIVAEDLYLRFDVLEMYESAEIGRNSEKNFVDVEIYYPYSDRQRQETPDGKRRRYVFLSLIGLLPACKILIPAYYNYLSFNGLWEAHKLVDKRGNFAGLTSVSGMSNFLKSKEYCGAIRSSVRYLDVKFEEPDFYHHSTKYYEELIEYIKLHRLERVRLDLSFIACLRWHTIFDALDRCAPENGNKMVIEKLSYKDGFKHLNANDFQRLHNYDVEAISFMFTPGKNDSSWIFDILPSFRNLKTLSIWIPVGNLRIAQRISQLGIKTLVLLDSCHLPREPGDDVYKFLRIVFNSSIDTVVLKRVHRPEHNYEEILNAFLKELNAASVKKLVVYIPSGNVIVISNEQAGQ